MAKRHQAFWVFLNITGTFFSFLSMKPLDSEVQCRDGVREHSGLESDLPSHLFCLAQVQEKIHIYGQQVKIHLTQMLYFQPSPDETRPLDHESTIFLIPAILKDGNNRLINRHPRSRHKPVKEIIWFWECHVIGRVLCSIWDTGPKPSSTTNLCDRDGFLYLSALEKRETYPANSYLVKTNQQMT